MQGHVVGEFPAGNLISAPGAIRSLVSLLEFFAQIPL